jgi:hypothetical protein
MTTTRTRKPTANNIASRFPVSLKTGARLGGHKTYKLSDAQYDAWRKRVGFFPFIFHLDASLKRYGM